MTFRERCWNLSCFSWLAAPVVGYWPGSHPRSSQIVWWVLASILVIGCSGFVKPRFSSKPIGLLMLAFIAAFVIHGVFLYHAISFEFATAWLMKASVILAAATLIAERTPWKFLLRCLLILLVFQVPVLILEYLGIDTPWRVAKVVSESGIVMESSRPCGTLSSRAGLSILAGFCSIWAAGWIAYSCGAVALMSTSLSGAAPSIARLAWKRGKFGRWAILAGLGVLLLIGLTCGPRIEARIEAWKAALILKNCWLSGWGFFPIPGTFREDALGGAALGPVQFTDFHCTWLDWAVRYGLAGILAIAPLIAWVLWETFSNPSEWKVWTLVLFVIAGSLQSMEGVYALGMLGLVWLTRLQQEASSVA